MTPEQKLNELKEELRGKLPLHIYLDACILLDQFIRVFDYKRRHDNTERGSGIFGYIKYQSKRLFYKAVVAGMLADGYIRDLRINATAGKILFPKHYKSDSWHKQSTLTATMKRVKADLFAVPDHRGTAIRICIVLNDHDPDHC